MNMTFEQHGPWRVWYHEYSRMPKKAKYAMKWIRENAKKYSDVSIDRMVEDLRLAIKWNHDNPKAAVTIKVDTVNTEKDGIYYLSNRFTVYHERLHHVLITVSEPLDLQQKLFERNA